MTDTNITAHAREAAIFCRDESRVDWHSKALWLMREKRDRAAAKIPEWEQLRQLGSDIKHYSLSRLPELLQQFERQCQANGIQVHWAYNGEQHNQIVYQILSQHKVKKLVKSKSLLTEECQMNPYLEDRGIEVVDTDIGERIVQLAKQKPSHIVVPTIHLNKEQVGKIFHKKMHTEAGASDPTYLTNIARRHLRQAFISADAAMTGVNMAIADKGAIVVCTNEGNADMGVNLPPLQLHSMGIEKIVPDLDSTAVFLRLLARNATGQSITSYSSIYSGPKQGGEMHIIIVDNGRSHSLKDKDFADALKCIGCGACLNTCPVYRRSGGHSYNHRLPGPIGIAIGSSEDHTHSMPWACTSCGSCTEVCPTKVPLQQLIHLQRRKKVKQKQLPHAQSKYLPLLGKVLNNRHKLDCTMTLARGALKHIPHRGLKPFTAAWSAYRELPTAPQSSFESWYKNNRNK